MRPWLVAVVALVGLLMSSGMALATGSPKPIDVSVSSTVALALSGNTVEVVAISPKRGSTYTDSWTGATKVSTELSPEGYYVSKATFSATPTGTHAVTYQITMFAGKSDVSWQGSGTTTIAVRAVTGGGGESGWPGF